LTNLETTKAILKQTDKSVFEYYSQKTFLVV